MKRHDFFYLVLFLVLFGLFPVNSFLKAQDKLLDVLESEVNREFAALKTQEIPAYYISYRVDDLYNYNISAEFGTLTNSNDYSYKILTITMRVGTPQLDNFHPLRDNYSSYSSYSRVELPSEENADAIKNIVWKATNDAYQEAVSKFSKVKANISVKIEEEDKAADFTMDAPNVFEEKALKPGSIKFDVKDWEKRVKKYSSEFLKDSAIFYGSASINYQILRKYFVSSCGDKIVQNSTTADANMYGMIKAKDGMEMPLFKSFYAFRPEGLPTDELIQKAAESLIKNLITLKNAPVAEPFSGPALLSAQASGVFFHEIFGHRIEGQRMKKEDDAQTFKKKVGELILPKSFSVYCDPAQKTYEGIDLNGFYLYDD